MTETGGPAAFQMDDRVRVVGETDHPEDPVGTVAGFVDGGIVVLFPLAGAEIRTASELRRAEG